MALIISQDNHIHAKAIADVVIHFFHFLAFVSSAQAAKTLAQQ